MKTVTYDIVIDSISSVHGEYPGSVDVTYHQEGGDLKAGEHRRRRVSIALSSAVINPDGSINRDVVADEVVARLGTTVVVELEED